MDEHHDEQIDHDPETEEEVDAATGDDVHDLDRSQFPEHLRFDDEQWADVEAARARTTEEETP